MKKVFLFSFLLLAIIACQKKYNSLPHGYYIKEYSNWAWGYQSNGWIIDSEGNVMSYDLPENWNKADSLGYITKQKLIENVSYCQEKINSVSNRKLYQLNKLIDNAATGTLSEKRDVAKDAGQEVYSCYQFDESKKLYKKIRLNVKGDWVCHNQNEDAIKISEWMTKLNQKSY